MKKINIPHNGDIHLCWHITSKCNANCHFCYRMPNFPDLPLNKNFIILNNIIKGGVKQITWTGGEALLYSDLYPLISYARTHNISCSLISNGIALDYSTIDLFVPYLSYLILSLDSVSDSINDVLGRGKEQLHRISNIVRYVRKNHPNVKIQINTLGSKLNLDSINDLISVLADLGIDYWRVFRFAGFRGEAKLNRERFWISEEAFESLRLSCLDCLSANGFDSSRVDFMNFDVLEQNYLLISPDGTLVKTVFGSDVVIGNLLVDNFSDLTSNLDI